MDDKSALMVGLLVNRFHRNAPEQFLKKFPNDVTDKISLGDLPTDDPTLCLESLSERVQLIHYSWLLPFFQDLTPALRSPFLSLLSSRQQQGIGKALKQSLGGSLAPSILSFLTENLVLKLNINRLLPRSCLPQTSLTILAQFSKDQLVELIDYLGIYDLSEEVKTILDKKYLKNIYSCLPPKRLKFLKLCLHLKTRIMSSRMGLHHWEGKCEDLLALLHRRGLTRLTKALVGQHPDLIWYISHILDTGRGKIIADQANLKENPSVTAGLIQQVQNALNFINKEGL